MLSDDLLAPIIESLPFEYRAKTDYNSKTAALLGSHAAKQVVTSIRFDTLSIEMHVNKQQ